LPFIANSVTEIINSYELKGQNKILLDAPTLYESGLDSICTAVIAVLSDIEFRKQRIIKRDNLTEQQAIDRLNAAKPDNFYTDKTEHIIYNNGKINEFLNKVENMLVLLGGS
jgi:dephospho-CoA kinase